MVQPIASDTDLEVSELVEANNQFALDLYSQLQSSKGNLFFSPFSISTALSMTSLGAKGPTLEEMTKTLRLPKTLANVHKSFKTILDRLKAQSERDPKPFDLSIANALWGQKGRQYVPVFLKATEANYGAGLHEVDFKHDTEAARGIINDWVAQATHDKIQNLIPPSALNDQTSLVLTNAIHFLAAWTDPFPASSTQADALFKLTSEATVKNPLMAREGNYAYADMSHYQALEIPYANGELGMVVILPKAVDGLAAVEASLTDHLALAKSLKALRTVKVKLSFPKFKLTESIKLGPVLNAMGMVLPFDPAKADFSGINTDRDLFISDVVHKAYVDVDEKGTEAAAATAVVMMLKSVMPVPTEPIVFKADHPFMFLIRERSTGSILFLGRLVNPSP